MSNKRSEKVAALIKQEVSKMLLTELKDPDFGFITITKVNVSKDLQHARIFYSVYGDDAGRKKNRQALDRATGYIRSEIGHRIKLRFVPEIEFTYDDSAEYADRIEHLLYKINTGEL